ncbi:hypothetical protein [Nonomuraea sp. NPDC048916]|uniref:hypothetical protein n=1 Tax=Nonomuraea sp. NPDC048916 TaxID=3154232 RepID=UPI0033D963BC
MSHATSEGSPRSPAALGMAALLLSFAAAISAIGVGFLGWLMRLPGPLTISLTIIL